MSVILFIDLTFASMLLKKAKTFVSNIENIPGSASPMNRMSTDNNKPSCSKTTDTDVVRHNVNVSDIEDYDEDECDIQDIDEFKR